MREGEGMREGDGEKRGRGEVGGRGYRRGQRREEVTTYSYVILSLPLITACICPYTMKS